MKSFILTLVLLLGAASVAAAQENPIGVRPTVGVFKAAVPIMTVDNGIDPNVELQAGPAVGLEADYRFHPWVGAYAGFSAAFSQLVHTSLFELEGPNPSSSSANVILSTLGVLVTPPAFIGVQPSLRVGLGTKWYDFEFVGLEGDDALSFAGDVGLGLSVQQGVLGFSTEARWLPSSFDPQQLPIQFGTEPAGQWQNDWLFQMGFRITPTL